MQLKRAMEILDIEYGDELAEIKKKYRKLMTKHHPDAIGSDRPEHRKTAQEINEAYSILQAEYSKIQKLKLKKKVWNAKVNEQAFTERIIYMPYTMEHDVKDLYQEICRGRYMWNPEEEDFEMLLRSVRMASVVLFRQSEEKSGLYLSERDWENIRFPYQMKVFYRLMQQFIFPYECISKLWSPESIDEKQREIYKFRAFLGEKDNKNVSRNIAHLNSGEQLSLIFSGENRIAARNARQESLGFLSLEEDCLYFLLIPLLRNHLAQIKAVVQDVQVKKGHGVVRSQADLLILVRITNEGKMYEAPARNIEIAELLNQYEKMIQNGVITNG